MNKIQRRKYEQKAYSEQVGIGNNFLTGHKRRQKKASV